MNWGHKIVVVYVLFVAGMVFLVVKSSQQNKDLVTENYFAKELVYQQKIDEMKRVTALSAPVGVSVNKGELLIDFPKDFRENEIAGEAVLYCPSDEKKDMQQSFVSLDQLVTLSLPKSYHGLFYLKLNWVAAGVSYYYEKKIIL